MPTAFVDLMKHITLMNEKFVFVLMVYKCIDEIFQWCPLKAYWVSGSNRLSSCEGTKLFKFYGPNPKLRGEIAACRGYNDLIRLALKYCIDHPPSDASLKLPEISSHRRGGSALNRITQFVRITKLGVQMHS